MRYKNKSTGDEIELDDEWEEVKPIYYVWVRDKNGMIEKSNPMTDAYAENHGVLDLGFKKLLNSGMTKDDYFNSLKK